MLAVIVCEDFPLVLFQIFPLFLLIEPILEDFTRYFRGVKRLQAWL